MAEKKQRFKMTSANTHLPGYPWPNDDLFWPLRDPFKPFPEEMIPALNENYAEIRKVFADSIAKWDIEPLWADGAPGFREEYGQPQPAIALKVHENGADLPTVLVCPGGGFLWKASYEGMPVAERFYDAGYNAAVLDYRVLPYTRDQSVSDGQRAIRWLRANAERLGLHPDKIAILGFSAGGRLSAAVGTHFDAGDPNAADPVERVSSRPDAVIPCYGSMSDCAYPKSGLQHNRDRQRYFAVRSPDTCISVDTPSFFIWQCNDMDDPRGALNLSKQLSVYGVPFELHLFPYGAHGTAMSDGQNPTYGGDDPHVGRWVEMCIEWLDLELNQRKRDNDPPFENNSHHMPGYPWPQDERYMPHMDTYGYFPEELVPDMREGYREIREYFAKAIAAWNPQSLWADGAPEFREDYGHPQPSIAVKVHPDGKNRGTIVICAGGAFVWKADYEAIPIGERFYELGYNTAVLDYRVAPYHQTIAHMDGQRAIRWLRANADTLGIDPDKIAVMGFSAGGMLANALGAYFTAGDPNADDPVERESSRPDAVIVCYGAFSNVAFPADENLRHDRARQALYTPLSGDAGLTVDAPPYFIWQCGDMDDPRNSINLGEQLTWRGIPFEMHIFPYGAHGTALSDGTCLTVGADDPHAAHWVTLCDEWLREEGF